MIKKYISHRLFGYFLIIIIISLSVVSTTSYIQSAKLLDRQLERYLSQMISYSAYHTELYLQTFERASRMILSDDQVMKFVDLDPKDNYDYYELTTRIQRQVFDSTFILYPQIDKVYIMGDHGKVISSQDATQYDYGESEWKELHQSLDKLLPESASVTVISSDKLGSTENQAITYARRIRGIKSHTPHGILAMNVNTKEIAKLWGQMDLRENGHSFIIDETGGFIDKPKDKKSEDLINDSIRGQLLTMGQGSFIEKLNGESRMFVSRELETTSWRLVISVPVSELREPIMNIRDTTVIAGILTLILALWLATRFGKSIVKPIQSLAKGMRLTEKGQWKHIEDIDRQDELGNLVKSYNLMVTRLSEMIEHVYEADLKSHRTELELQKTELEQHKAEFQALQLQINPHFLYNSLETIKCYAVIQDSEEIMDMVEAMAAMLRYSIQTNLSEITVVNELKHVLNYMTILQHRTQRHFELEVNISPAFLLHKMVRLTLQPLIENAFQHAFPNGISEHHFIRISSHIEEDRFIILVEDNGVGMTNERLEQLNQKLLLNQLAEADSNAMYHQGGLGLMNVNRRIQMVYGEEYGLKLQSTLYEGTKIIMYLPVDK